MNTTDLLRAISKQIAATVQRETGHSPTILVTRSEARGAFVLVEGLLEACDAARALLEGTEAVRVTKREIWTEQDRAEALAVGDVVPEGFTVDWYDFI